MITRHNYEELFLLYLDNELSPADRLNVENFVNQNPDLLEELESFRQCRLIPGDESSFGSHELLLKIASAGRLSLFARTYRMTRVAAAALVLLIAGLALFIAVKKNSVSQNILAANDLPSNNGVAGMKPPRTQPLSLAQQPISSTIEPLPATPNAYSSGSHALSSVHPLSSVPHGLASAAQTGVAVARRSAKKFQPAVTPGAHGALYLATTHQQKDVNNVQDEQVPDPVLTGTRISVQRRVAAIGLVNTKAPERIFVADNNEGRQDQPYPQSTGSSETSLAILTAQRDPSSGSADGFTEQVPAGKNKLVGVFRKISHVLERTTAQNDNDRHAILIGNLQIAF
jgi:hypothetical protein